MKYLITIISIVFLFSATTVYSADDFTANNVQSNFGEFRPVLDEALSGNDFTANQVQSVWGEFMPVLDQSAGGVVAVTPNFGTFIIFEE